MEEVVLVLSVFVWKVVVMCVSKWNKNKKKVVRGKSV